jgi:hypothetical protein
MNTNTNSNNLNSNLNLNKIKTKPANAIIKPFNKELANSFLSEKSSSKKKNKNTNSEFKDDIKKYQNSFDDIIQFSKKITLPKKKSINCIIYHADNSDGVMSANIVVKFLTENKAGDDVVIIPAKPSSGAGFMNKRLEKYESQIRGRNLIILDLQYNKENLDYFKLLAKDVIIIDDHPIGESNNSNKHFIGNNSHASVAYTWKFFYPKVDVPLYAQIIDNDDRKLQLPYLSKYRNMSSFYNYRIFHSPYLQKLGIKFDKVSDFELLDTVVKDELDNLLGTNINGISLKDLIGITDDDIESKPYFIDTLIKLSTALKGIKKI